MFVSGGRKDQRMSLPKTRKDLEQLNDDDENIFMTSIHDRYVARADDLNGQCLAYFAVNYDPVSACDDSSVTDIQDCEDNDDEAEEGNNIQEDNHTNNKNETITLKSGLGKMIRRKCEAILQTNRYNLSKK